MVYESDFYTVRRPYSRPTITSYSVTGCRPILSMRNYIAPSGTHSRIRLSVLMGELNRIQNRSRPRWSSVPTEDFLCSRPLVTFDDEAKHIRAAADRLLRYVYTRVPHRSSHLPRVISTYDRYAPDGRYTSKYFGTVPDDILSMSYYYDPARVTIGRGHLSCVTYAGGRGYPRRKHLYSDEYRDINDEIKFRSYYNKIMNPNRTEEALLLPTGFASRLLLADRHLTGPDEGRAIIFKSNLTKPAPGILIPKAKDKPIKKEKVKRSVTLDDASKSTDWIGSQETTPNTKMEQVWARTEEDTVRKNSEDVFQEPAPLVPEETPVKEKRKKSLSKKKSIDEYKTDAVQEPTSRKSSYATETTPSLARQASQPSEPAPTVSRQTSQTGASLSRQTSRKSQHEDEATPVVTRQISQTVEPEEEPTVTFAPQTVEPEEEPTATLARQTSQTVEPVDDPTLDRQEEEPTVTFAPQTAEPEEEPTVTFAPQTAEPEEEPTPSLVRQTSQRADPESEPEESMLSRQISQKSEVPEEPLAPTLSRQISQVEPTTPSLSRKASTVSEVAVASTASRKGSSASEVPATPSMSRKASAAIDNEIVQEEPAKDDVEEQIQPEETSAQLEVSKSAEEINAMNETENDLKITEDESSQLKVHEGAMNGLNVSTQENEETVEIEGGYITTNTSIEVKSYHQETIVTSEQSEDDGQTDDAEISNTAISPEPLVEEPTSPY